MARVLKKNGEIRIITDNAGCIFFHLLKATHYGEYEKFRKRTPLDRQYELFTPWHLINHFKAVGLKIKRVEYFINEDGLKKRWHKIIYKLASIFLGKSLSYPQIIIIGYK
jgi:tRNA G46 methylase TrmB